MEANLRLFFQIGCGARASLRSRATLCSEQAPARNSAGVESWDLRPRFARAGPRFEPKLVPKTKARLKDGCLFWLG